jgi:hypothetical protein
MNTVLNFSLITPQLRADLPDLRFTEIDSSVPAGAAAALTEKGRYDYLVVKDQGNVAGFFFPEYVKGIIHARGAEIFQANSFDMNALPHPAFSLVQIIDRIDAHNIDFRSDLVNVNPTIFLCSVGGGHIVFRQNCPIHHVRANRI